MYTSVLPTNTLILIDNINNLVILIFIWRINAYEFRVWPWKNASDKGRSKSILRCFPKFAILILLKDGGLEWRLLLVQVFRVY